MGMLEVAGTWCVILRLFLLGHKLLGSCDTHPTCVHKSGTHFLVRHLPSLTAKQKNYNQHHKSCYEHKRPITLIQQINKLYYKKTTNKPSQVMKYFVKIMGTYKVLKPAGESLQKQVLRKIPLKFVGIWQACSHYHNIRGRVKNGGEAKICDLSVCIQTLCLKH